MAVFFGMVVKCQFPRYFRKKFDISLKTDEENLKKKAKIAYGDNWESDYGLKFMKYMDKLGFLEIGVQEKLMSTNEQRRLDHLAAVRAKKSLRASKDYTNRSFE